MRVYIGNEWESAETLWDLSSRIPLFDTSTRQETDLMDEEE